MPLTIVSVWALALPVRGRLETILIRPASPSAGIPQPAIVAIVNKPTIKIGGK